MSKQIPLYKTDLYALVDDDDSTRLAPFTWHLNQRGYVVTYHQAECMMQRMIMQPPEEMSVIHLNDDLLDHRRENLRVVTRSQSIQRQKKQPFTSSKYKGVQIHQKSGRWRVFICPQGRKVELGYFDKEEDAARVYDQAALDLYGSEARTNFTYTPDNLPRGLIKAKREPTSRYRGVVRKASGRYSVVLCYNKQRIHIGCFVDEIEAALAYDQAALKQLGNQAKLNFPEGYHHDKTDRCTLVDVGR